MWTLVSFAFFTGLVGFLTFVLTRRDDHTSSAGYFLAGRTLTGGYIAGSLLLTNLSTEQLVGLNGAAFADGICVMAWEVIAATSLVILALCYLPKYLKSGIATVPQFLEDRFDAGTRAITTLIFVIAYAGILLPIILYTGAKGMTQILDMEALTGIRDEFTLIVITVWLIGILGSIYAIFGGLRTVAVSDTLNGFGLLTGGILIAYFGLKSVDSNGALAALQTIRDAHPEKFNSIGGPQQSVPFSTLFTGVLLLNLFYWTTNQQIIQRTFGAKSLAEAQKGVLFAGVFKILAPIILVIPGIVAFYLYGRVSIDDEMLVIKDVTTEDVAIVVRSTDAEQILHGAAALEWLETDTPQAAFSRAGDAVETPDGQQWTVENVLGPGVVITQSSSGDNVFHSGLSESELNRLVPPRNKDNAYGRLVRDVLPGPMAGFFAAVVIGAILSSFNSALNSTATLFSLGVYKAMLHPDATEERVIQIGKIFGWAIAIASMLSAPFLLGQDSIFGYLQKMNGLYFIPIFSVMLIGIATKRVPALAAKVGLVLGFLAIALGYFVFPDVVSAMHEFHFLGIVFASLLGLMLVIGQISPRETTWEHKYSGDVDLTPWKFATPLGIGLILFVMSIYIYFADLSILQS